MIILVQDNNKKNSTSGRLYKPSLVYLFAIFCCCVFLSIAFSFKSFAKSYTGVININNGTGSEDCTKGNGQKDKDARKIEAFQEVDVSGAFVVKITCGREQMVSLEGDGNILPLVKTRVKKGVLSLSAPGSICLEQPVVVTLAAPRLEKVISDGANEINMQCESGESSLTLLLKGSSEFNFSGSLLSLTARLEDAAELDASRGTVMQADIHAESASNALVSVQKELIATSSDASEIYYKDNSTVIIKKIITEAGSVGPH